MSVCSSLKKVMHTFSQMVLTFYQCGTLNNSLLDNITYAFSCKISGKKKKKSVNPIKTVGLLGKFQAKAALPSLQ